jgi:hypothetical protein
VLKTKPGEKVKWPSEVKGADLDTHRRQIKKAVDQGWREVPHESKRQEILQQMHEKSIGYHLDKCEHCATHKIRTGIPKPPTKPITTERICN